MKEVRVVLEVDQVAVAIAAGDEHRVDVRVGDHHVLGHLERGDGRAAAHLDVDAPRRVVAPIS